MCTDHSHEDTIELGALDDVEGGIGHWEEGPALPSSNPSRRLVLGGAVAAVAAPLMARGVGSAAASEVSAVTGQRSYLAAMHMHGSFSEQQGSWEGQSARMVEESVDLMFMSDHSHGLLATHTAADLTGLLLHPSTAGAASTKNAKIGSDGSLSLAVQSSGSAAATAAAFTDPDDKGNLLALRTSVMGQVWHHTFGAVDVDPNGLYEIRVQLSHHPAGHGRPDAIYGLCYRFGPGLAVGRTSENGGTIAVFVQPLPPSGTTVDLDLEGDVTTAWPELIPQDHGTQNISFTVTSPRAGVLAAVDVVGMTFERAARNAVNVAQVQQRMADSYSRQFGIAIQPAVELGENTHHSAFLDQQYFAADEEYAYQNPAGYTKKNVAAVHQAGGVVSYNHPFGTPIGSPATGQAEVTKRQNTYKKLAKVDLYGVDILEVGYAVRGGMSIDAHLDLWDTFSRQARFLTGNGVSDSHDSSKSRLKLANEFATGIWCGSVGMGDVVPGLASGRVYTRHVSSWPGGSLDLSVDDTYLMGQVVVGSATTRTLTITATRLPAGAVVQIVGGLVDYQGVDPGTTIVAQLPASSFSSAGVATYRLDVPGSAFVRLTVRNSAGTVIGVGNPVWLLQTNPPNGVPAARRP